MTAVIGILNKNGVALAADSAVTMTQNVVNYYEDRPRKKTTKIENSANKMIRLSNTDPVSVMITGAAGIARVPWDILIRQYRRKKGANSLPTVGAYIEDFFNYISSQEVLFTEEKDALRLGYRFYDYLNRVIEETDALLIDEDGFILNLDEAVEIINGKVRADIESMKKEENLPSFKCCSLKRFRAIMTKDINFDDPQRGELYKAVSDSITELYFTSAKKKVGYFGTTLIFSGFGSDEKYPSLYSVKVDNFLFDNKIRFFIDKEVHISDDHTSAICPFAQYQVAKGLITGIRSDLLMDFKNIINNLIYDFANDLASYVGDSRAEVSEIRNIISMNIKQNDYINELDQLCNDICSKNESEWLDTIKDASVQKLARLAKTLIEMACYQKQIQFEAEGVGGPVDLAVITKANGFNWLQRKSWYNHKNVNGSYGSLGI